MKRLAAIHQGTGGLLHWRSAEFQAFNADKTVNGSENLDRCFACHRGQAQKDFLFTLDRMKTAN